MQDKREYLTNRFKSADIFLSSDQVEVFLQYADILEEWNRKMNLTAITDFEEVVEKHFLDSVYPFALQDFSSAETLLDVGSGAGFPGIPLKILHPGLEITLLDSLNKRITFLNEVIQRLNLDKITAIHGRAEELAQKSEFREKYDLVAARAVAPLNILAEYCLPFVRGKGRFLAYKGENITEELNQAENALKLLGSAPPEALIYRLPGSEAGRSLVICPKMTSTAAKYPRRAGNIAKKPL